MTDRENTLRAVRFERPDHIPMRFSVSEACWFHYPQNALEDLMAGHPGLFPGFEAGEGPVVPSLFPWRRRGISYTDSWGCAWETPLDGITGAVVRRPLEDWEGLEGFRPPDPENENGWGPCDWEAAAQSFRSAERAGRMKSGSLRHGHTFLTLTYIRGYTNLVCDMADHAPQLQTLIEMVEAFNAAIVDRYVDLGAEWMGYPEDLGMQTGPMLSPSHFQEYIKPVYDRLMGRAKDAGCVIHVHCDGDTRALVEDILSCGVDVLNLQDLVHGIDWLRDTLKGRICIDLDIDRQDVTRFGSPDDIDALIRREVEMLGSREGGLMMVFGLYPGTPIENAAAVMDAMERYAGLHT